MDYDYLQSSTNFRDMTTKNSGVGIDRGIYDSPYDAFTNYMNVLGDFCKRVESLYPSDIENEELNALLTTIKNQDTEIAKLNKELQKAKEKVEDDKSQKKAKAPAKAAKVAKKPAEKPAAKPAAKKPASKKAPAKK